MLDDTDLQAPQRSWLVVPELIAIGLSSLLSPLVLVVVCGVLLRFRRLPATQALNWRLRRLAVLLTALIVSSVATLMWMSLTRQTLPRNQSLVDWCSAAPQDWAVACVFPHHRTGAAVVSIFMLAVVAMSAYRDVIQLGANQKDRVFRHPIFLLIAFVAWCVVNAAFERGASFTGNASESATSDLVFFLVVTAIVSWAAHIAASILFDRMRALVVPRE